MVDPRHKLIARRGRTTRLDPRGAVAELRDQIDQPGLSGVVFFATPQTDFPALAAAMQDAFGCPTIGCTTAGEFSSEFGHERGCILAASLASPLLRLHTHLLRGTDSVDPAKIRQAAEGLTAARMMPESGAFALVMSDGLSMSEERLVGGLSASMGAVPLVGGSAGDDLAFRQTSVACMGETVSRGAALALVETDHPFQTFHAHHFRATEERLVITDAEPGRRRVYEINGLPAAQGYAAAVGLSVEQLSPEVFSEHPLMLKIGGSYFIRSIQRANDDGSLTFFCAIDHGMVLRVADGRGLVESLSAQMGRVQKQVEDPCLTIGFDCVLRRLEVLSRGLHAPVAECIRAANLIGFSTYGEQYDGLHVNQTLTGVALGNAA
jgi:hypothetical protein